jgi:hypothetical protein
MSVCRSLRLGQIALSAALLSCSGSAGRTQILGFGNAGKFF